MAQGAEIKIATVDIQKLFKDYHLTAKMQEQINVEQARIKKDNEERLARIRTVEEQLETIGKQLEDTTIADSKKQELFKDRQVKLQEGSALDQERRKWLARREQAQVFDTGREAERLVHDARAELKRRARRPAALRDAS